MKKIISILLVLVMCLSMYACSANGTKLTLDNYSDYLKISNGTRLSDDIKLASGNDYKYFGVNDSDKYVYARTASSSYRVYIEVEGVSPNFQYSDITLEIKVSGHYFSCPKVGNLTGATLEKRSLEQILTVELDLNVSGEGELYMDYTPIPNNNAVPDNIIVSKDRVVTWDVTVEIIGITGSITPVK